MFKNNQKTKDTVEIKKPNDGEYSQYGINLVGTEKEYTQKDPDNTSLQKELSLECGVEVLGDKKNDNREDQTENKPEQGNDATKEELLTVSGKKVELLKQNPTEEIGVYQDFSNY
jgi:hypothetical protein